MIRTSTRLWCLLLLLPTYVSAQPGLGDFAAVAGPEDVTGGALVFAYEGRLVTAPMLEADYAIEVSGPLARTRLTQRFENRTGDWIEAMYLYPLPADVVVDSLNLVVGDRRVVGEVQEREAARASYERAKNAGQQAALVERERPNLFTTSVANIGPTEIITIEIEYQQLVPFDAGQFELRLPLVAGPRYIPVTMTHTAPSDVLRINGPVLPPGSARTNPVRVNIDLDAGVSLTEVRSLHHEVVQTLKSDQQRLIELTANQMPADRDFVLQWQVMLQQPLAAVFRERRESTDFGLLMVLPPQGLHGVQLPRDIVFVIDTSGSMDGTSIQQAREALLFALQQLGRNDRFNIIEFASATRLWQLQPVPAERNQLQAAAAHVRRISSGGGTEMFPAVNAALRQFPDSSTGRVQQVVFITDGNVGNEADLFHAIETALGKTRLYTVGIGSAPNSSFMIRAARFGRGTHTFIGDTNEVAQRMGHLFEKISAPVLTDIEIDWGDGLTRETYPERIADLFAGEPLTIATSGPLPPVFTLRGTTSGAQWSQRVTVDTAEHSDGIAKFWAGRRIEGLLSQPHRRERGDAIYDDVVKTALDHSIVSRYTSLVAVDKQAVRAPGQPLGAARVPQHLPAGWVYDSVYGRLPAGATAASLYLLVGTILLGTCFLSGMIVVGRRCAG